MRSYTLRKGDVVIVQVENIAVCDRISAALKKFTDQEELQIKFMVLPKDMEITVFRQAREINYVLQEELLRERGNS